MKRIWSGIESERDQAVPGHGITRRRHSESGDEAYPFIS
jgi:hypothetical protein